MDHTPDDPAGEPIAALLPADAATMAAVRPPVTQGGVGLCLCLMLIAFNLRPVFASLSVVLPEVRRDTGLGAFAISSLTTLPVLCLGLFAPFAPRLARRFGIEHTLLGVLLLTAFGTGLRFFDSITLLYLGTACAGVAIAIGNVLLPGFVKGKFAGRIALVTGLYSMALCGGAAGAAALTVPIERIFGGSWRLGLAVWAVPALLTAAIWTMRLPAREPLRAASPVLGLMRAPLAWQVTLFMGLQSAMAYCVLGWLAPILRLRGIDALSAGLIVSFSVMMQVVASLIVPSFAVRSKDQRLIAVILAALATIGLLGLMFAPEALLWLIAGLQGIGQGGLFAAAMTIITLRSADPNVAAHLSGMAQGFGYVMAASGPLIVGVLLDGEGGFSKLAILFVSLGLAIMLAGLGAGRSLQVGGTMNDGRLRE